MLPLPSGSLKSREDKALCQAFGQVFGQEAGLDELPEVPSNMNCVTQSRYQARSV